MTRLSTSGLIGGGASIVLGLLIAAFDAKAPFGDDTAKATIVLWLVASGAMGLCVPRKPWRWALLIGPWLSVVHLVRHLVGLPDSFDPATYTTLAILVPVSIVVCLVGAYGGWAVRQAAGSLSADGTR